MRILVDENIPLAGELFGSLGDVVMVNGREVDEGYPGLERFDAMAIRSVTRVTPALVDRAANLRAIGTATIGTDHVDVAHIRSANRTRRRPIEVFSAPGSNAESVADYVWYALAHVTRDAMAPLADSSLGIIGFGNCGNRVARRAEGFGMQVLRCDPPLAERDPKFVSHSLEEALGADFVMLHVPLTRAGEAPHPTHHMIGAAELGLMKPDAWLVNTSRGGVVDSQALVAALQEGTIGGAVLDVFEGEPTPAEGLIEWPGLATPHVAGYAVEGKRRGAIVVYQAFCRLFGRECPQTQPLLMSGFVPPEGERVPFPGDGPERLAADNAVRSLLARTHDIGAVSRELKGTLGSDRRGELFDRMRRDYEHDYGRHELAVYRVGFGDSVPEGLRAQVAVRLRGFGAEVVEQGAHYLLTVR